MRMKMKRETKLKLARSLAAPIRRADEREGGGAPTAAQADVYHSSGGAQISSAQVGERV